MTSTLFRQLNNCIKPHTNCLNTWSPLAVAFNSRPNTKQSFVIPKQNSGLFQEPDLTSSSGFYVLKDKCASQTEALVSEAVSKHRKRKMVEIFDELSNTLCKVADLAEFIRIAHPSQDYGQAAEYACASVSGLVEKLNTHRELYDALKEVVTNGDRLATDEVDRHVAKLFLFDFEQSGIQLRDTERQKVVNLNEAILLLGQQFVAGASKPGRINKSLVPDTLRHAFAIDGDEIVVPGLCADSSNPLIREAAYRIFFHTDREQDYLLAELLQARNELARVCGFSSYAERALGGSTVETPKVVMDFLGTLSEKLRSRADIDFEIMDKMKAKENPGFGPVACWDVPYFTHKAKKEWFQYTAMDYSPYLSLGACMEGLNNLFTSLYGISFKNVEMANGESWSEDVYKLAVIHENEGVLGHIYCDFYERENKPNQDCHFTIRGGKTLPDGSYQMPIVVLMLNFPVPRWSRPSLLSPGMVDNLFHEMGHAMHSMLARTSYQHVTGTRCSTDFAEVPSVLMEYFAADPRVLGTFARHFQTNEPMPEDMLRKLCASKHLFTASEMQVQLFYSALDQEYHGTHPLQGTTTDVLADTQRQYYSLPYVSGTSWQLRFCHLVGYGAKYYSYLVSRAVASRIWQTYFEADPWSRTRGERYRAECLAHGGGKPPRQLVADFLRRDPTADLLTESLVREIDDHQSEMKTVVEV